jgi:hypothetical protein
MCHMQIALFEFYHMDYCHPRGDNIRYMLRTEHSWTQTEGTMVENLEVATTLGKTMRSFERNEPKGWKLEEGNL